MTAIADLVSVLLSAGLSADVVRQAIDLAQQHAQESREIRRQSADNPRISADDKRRAYDRERQRKKRMSANGALTLLPSSSTDSQEKKEGVVGRAAAVRGTRLPSDWALSNADACFALPLVGERRVAQETEKFRDYWHARAGPGGVKLDWAAVWRTWIRKAVENGKPNGKSSPTMDAFDDLIARTGGTVEGDPPMRDVTPRGGHHG